MSAETDKDKKTPPKTLQAGPKPTPQPQAGRPAKPVASAFPRRRVWPD